jgi:anaerobic dimethyl sulfoxide reductase subunit B (iron-sulfur subunit)
MQFGFYFDQTRCIGCDTCVVACKDWHDIEAGPAGLCRVTTLEQGKFPDIFVVFLFNACFHCEDPQCIRVCPVSAIHKRESDGIVIVDSEICLGRDACGACSDACIYKAPAFGSGRNSKMKKCDLCVDRLAEGTKPICVAACRTRALEVGPIEELKSKYRTGEPAVGFLSSGECAPSVVFLPKQ